MKCQHCTSKAILPFKCYYCSRYFCSAHRLPENHECPGIQKALQGRKEGEQYYYRIPSLKTKVFEFSAKEIRHLTLATFMVIGVGFSIYIQFQTSLSILYMIGSALVFGTTFILHEIAHKLAAQHYRLWAEFRLTLVGSLITLFSIFSPLKIISPGVVQVAGVADRKTIGKVSIAGPLTNIIQGMILLSLNYYIETPFLVVGAILNSLVALFNLVPFGIFDGKKVFWWNKQIWAFSFAASIILTYLTLAV